VIGRRSRATTCGSVTIRRFRSSPRLSTRVQTRFLRPTRRSGPRFEGDHELRRHDSDEVIRGWSAAVADGRRIWPEGKPRTIPRTADPSTGEVPLNGERSGSCSRIAGKTAVLAVRDGRRERLRLITWRWRTRNGSSADEWEVSSGSGFLNFTARLRAHGTGFAITIVSYRVLWELVGLAGGSVPESWSRSSCTSLPTALLRIVSFGPGFGRGSRRSAASVFGVFGCRARNIMAVGVQGTFTGRWVRHTPTLLADHDGPFDRRDGSGSADGRARLCSGVRGDDDHSSSVSKTLLRAAGGSQH